MRYTILIVEDDADIIDMLTLYMDTNEFYVIRANDGEEGLKQMKQNKVDLALVDLMMPKVDGYAFIREARKTSNIPFIIMSAKNQDTDKVMGLNIGADAYLTKPFNPFEVIAYIKAMLRRYYTLGAGHNPQASRRIALGDLELDCERFLLRKNGENIPLTSSEFKILSKLMHHPGRVFTKAQLYECINDDLLSEADENTITVHISNLRAKLNCSPDDAVSIKTIRGLGYKIESK